MGYNLPFLAVVYFDPELSDYSYPAWTFASNIQIIMRQIQRSIFDIFKKGKMGIFDKLEAAFSRKMKIFYVNLSDFSETLHLILE